MDINFNKWQYLNSPKIPLSNISFFEGFFSMTLVTRWIWSTVECLFPNPNWKSGMLIIEDITKSCVYLQFKMFHQEASVETIKLLLIGLICFNSSFSNNFDIVGRRDIGLYDVTSSPGLFGFFSMTVCAVLK